MLPTIEKLASEVAKAIEKPGQAFLTKATTEGARMASKVATNSLKTDILVQQKISEFKDRNVINSEDIAYACAFVDILYRNLLEMRVNNIPLRNANPDTQSVPAAFIFFGPKAVIEADKNVHQTIKRLRAAKVCFSDIFPACVAAITAKEYMDLKSLAGKLSSMMVADAMLIKDAIDTCRNGVQICDKGLSWANSYDKTLEQWLVAGKAKHAG